MIIQKDIKKGQKQGNILGIDFDSTTTEGVLRKIASDIGNKRKFYITTPNPEIVMQAMDDPKLKIILNRSDISVPDGIGIVAAYKFMNLPKPKESIKKDLTLFVQGLGVGFSVLFDRKWVEEDMKLIKGRVLFTEMIKLANRKGWKVVLVGDRKRSAMKARESLKKNYLKLKLIALEGPNLTNNGTPTTKQDKNIEMDVVRRINKEKPQLLFIGFGAPKQEKWLYRWYQKLEIGGAMVVGGTFDYISGVSKLPPKWIENMNLEWLWRLFTGSQEMDRINTAFPQFVKQIFLDKYNSK